MAFRWGRTPAPTLADCDGSIYDPFPQMATASNIEYTDARRVRREARRRQVRRRRLAAFGVLAALSVAAVLGLVQLVTGAGGAGTV